MGNFGFMVLIFAGIGFILLGLAKLYKWEQKTRNKVSLVYLLALLVFALFTPSARTIEYFPPDVSKPMLKITFPIGYSADKAHELSDSLINKFDIILDNNN